MDRSVDDPGIEVLWQEREPQGWTARQFQGCCAILGTFFLALIALGVWNALFETEISDDFHRIRTGMRPDELGRVFPHSVLAMRDLKTFPTLDEAARNSGREGFSGKVRVVVDQGLWNEKATLHFRDGKLASRDVGKRFQSNHFLHPLWVGMPADSIMQQLPRGTELRVLPPGLTDSFEVHLSSEADKLEGFTGTLFCSDMNFYFDFYFEVWLDNGIVRRSKMSRVLG